MTKRKRTWTEETSEALPDSTSQAGDLANARDLSVMDVLPGITRKITACGACRKQKVCQCCRAESGWLKPVLTNPRSNVTCRRAHHALDAGVEGYHAC